MHEKKNQKNKMTKILKKINIQKMTEMKNKKIVLKIIF